MNLKDAALMTELLSAKLMFYAFVFCKMFSLLPNVSWWWITPFTINLLLLGFVLRQRKEKEGV